jgi:glycosyltransferase involved in cell wall biosynthesis
VPPDRVRFARAEPQDVPAYLAAADVGISFSSAGTTRLAASPTKVAEYLATGIPVIQSADVGDMDRVIGENRIGALVATYDAASYLSALQRIAELRNDPALPERCRETARMYFDLRAVGGQRYRRVYEELVAAGE